MNPDKNQGVTIVQQPFDMNLFLNHQVDSASAMTYNELAQVLESKNPKTGKLYTLNDLNVIKMQNVGTGMLEDGLFSTGKWLSDPANQAIAVKFIEASLEGWIYCRDHQAACVNITLQYGPTLPKGHQTWQMNEINKLIWPSASGIGIMNKADVHPDGDDREAVRRDQEDAVGRVPHRPRREGRRAAEGRRHRRQRHRLEAGDRQRDGRRKVSDIVSRGGRISGRRGRVRAKGEAVSVLIKGGRVVTAADDYVADVFIDGERVTLIGESLDLDADRVIDARGKLVLPGCVDPHTHLDMPFGGTVTIDDVESGQIAAAFGGTTCHVDFCIQAKGQTFADALADWHAKADGKQMIDMGYHIADHRSRLRRRARRARHAARRRASPPTSSSWPTRAR